MGAYPAYKKDYDAMVFIDGWDVVAINSDGSVIDHGTNWVDDSDVIQSAIDYVVSATGGGKISIGAGVFVIYTPILVKSYIQLCGEGTTTTLYAETGLDDDVIYIEDQTNCLIENMWIAGNSAGQASGSGIYINHAASTDCFNVVKDVVITDCKEYGVEISSNSDYVSLLNNIIGGCGTAPVSDPTLTSVIRDTYGHTSIQSRRDYDAMVFIEGTSVIAVDSNGVCIARGVAGTDDATVIQAALDYVYAQKAAGTVILSNDKFYTSATITLPRGIALIGSGFSNSGTTPLGTTIYMGSGVNSDIISSDTKSHQRIENLVLDGNGANNTTGRCIYMTGGVNNVIRNVLTMNHASTQQYGGVYILNSTTITIENLYMVANVVGDYTPCQFGGYNFSINRVIAESATGVNASGISFNGVHNSHVSNLYVEDVSYGIGIAYCYNTVFEGLSINNNNAYCVSLQYCKGTTVIGANYSGVAATRNFYIYDTCSNCTVIGAVGFTNIVDTSTDSTIIASSKDFGTRQKSRNEIRSMIAYLNDILGSPRLIVPIVNTSGNRLSSGATVNDLSRHANDLTCSVDLSVLTEQSTFLFNPYFQGESVFINLDGTDEYLYRANDTDFDFGDAATDDAFSIVCCVNPDDVTSRQIIGKWDDNNQREWRLFFDANGYPTLQLYDESADTYIGRQDQTAFTTGSWQVIVATYDGSGINAGCKIYIDGVQLDDTDYDNGVYVAMEAVTANLMVGALKNAAVYSEYYDGKMTWIGVAAKELSPDEVWSLTQRLKGVLGI